MRCIPLAAGLLAVVGLAGPTETAIWWTLACDPTSACDHNHSMRGPITAADEERQRAAWWAAVADAGHTIGRPAVP